MSDFDVQRTHLCMTTDNFCFYLQNRLIQTGQTGGQQYSDASPFSVPYMKVQNQPLRGPRERANVAKRVWKSFYCCKVMNEVS